MTPKRAADQAFAYYGEQVTASSGFDAPTPEVRHYDNVSPIKLSMPGRWPGSDDSASHISEIEYEAPTRPSILSWIGNWALAKAIGIYQYIRPQQVIVHQIVREDGARKKRIIEAAPVDEPAVTANGGLTDEPPTPTPILTTRASIIPRTRIYKQGRGRGKEHNVLLPFGAPVPAPISAPAPAPALAPTSITTVISTPSLNKLAHVDEQVAHDDSLDFSFSDVIDSTTPPGCSATAHVVHLEASQVYQNQAPKVAQVPRPRSRSIDEISPNSHLNIIRKSSATPVRKALLKLQSNKHKSVTEVRNNSFAEKHAPSTNTDITDAPSAKEAYHAYYNHVETVDQDLSELPDAPPLEDFVEETDPNYRLKPRVLRKTVRWSEFANAKPFYEDEAACDMLDSTLELINSPAKPLYRDTEHHDDSDSDTHVRKVASSSSSEAQDSPQQSAAVGFSGVPDSTWDDSDVSLSELELSEELLADLRNAKLAASAAASRSPSPPPAPPVVVKDLVTPLSSDEQNKLKAVAIASDSGRNRDYQIKQYKINAHDFSTLLPVQFSGDRRAWVNDNIVNEYLALMTEEAKKKAGYEKSSGCPPPMHVVSSFWYTTFKTNRSNVTRWARKAGLAGKKYLDANLVLYPICHNGHWRLLAVRPKDRTIEYLDSMGMEGDEFINAFKSYIAEELKEAWIEDEWTVLTNQRSTQQVNGSDCGVFTILNALALLQEKELTKVISCDGMLDARERIAASLVAYAVTTEFD